MCRATYRQGLQSDEAGFCGPFITLTYCIVVDGCLYIEYDKKRKIYLKVVVTPIDFRLYFEVFYVQKLIYLYDKTRYIIKTTITIVQR